MTCRCVGGEAVKASGTLTPTTAHTGAAEEAGGSVDGQMCRGGGGLGDRRRLGSLCVPGWISARRYMMLMAWQCSGRAKARGGASRCRGEAFVFVRGLARPLTGLPASRTRFASADGRMRPQDTEVPTSTNTIPHKTHCNATQHFPRCCSPVTHSAIASWLSPSISQNQSICQWAPLYLMCLSQVP